MTNEVYEVAVSEDGITFGPFEEFIPGDVRLLDNFVRFRVTVFGDFSEDEYRLRGFSGIVDDATTSSGGFGVSPFGRFPFGDGGVCLESSGEDLSGELLLTGTLDITTSSLVLESLSGTMSMSGSLAALAKPSLSGSLALSGTLVGEEINAIGVLLSVGPSNGGNTFSTATPFRPFNDLSSAVSAAAGSAQIRLPIAVTLTNMFAVLNSAMAGGQSSAIRINVNGVGNNTLKVRTATPNAPNNPTLAGLGAGNVDNGSHSYVVTFVIDGFENPLSAATATVTVANNAVNGQISLTGIPTGPTGTTARKIYRSTAGNVLPRKLVTTINDNVTTTLTDNVADASLGAAVQTTAPWFLGSASGVLSLAQDDLVCYEATDFAGGGVNVSFRSVTHAYSALMADGFILTPSPRHYNAGSANRIGFITRGGTGASDGFIPKQLTVKEGTLTVDTAPGGVAAYTLKVQKNATSVTQVGSTLTLSGTATSVRGTIGGSIPLHAAGAVDLTKSNFMQEGNTGSPASVGAAREMFSYQVDSPDDALSFFVTGQGAFNWDALPGPNFPSFGFYALTAPAVVEVDSQITWPEAGIFKYLMVYAIADAGTTIVVDLRINGSTVMSVTIAGNPTGQVYTNLIDTASVSVGDKVNWRYTRTAGAGAIFQAELVIGYTRM